MTTIVTHVSPDWDAIGATWLLKRFGGNGFDTADVVFVNTGNPDPQVLAMADAVVDTGREYNPRDYRFDHHQLPGFRANETSATDQVFSWLLTCGVDIHHLIPLSNLILCGDTGRKEDGAHYSRLVGIHALLSAQKAKRLSDADLMAWGFSILDDLAATLKARHDAAATLEQHTVYISEDGLLVALHNAPQGATFAAHENGRGLWCSTPNCPTCRRMRGA